MSELPPEKAPTIRVTAMPADANPYGDIFGGWLMGQMDLAAGSVASRRSGGRAVTIAADAMKFHMPVIVGDEVSVYAELIAVGRTSMTIEVEAWRRARHRKAARSRRRVSFSWRSATTANRGPCRRQIPDSMKDSIHG